MHQLYQDKKNVIHACDSGELKFYKNPINLVWTKCGKDVPANKSFKSKESVTCPNCKQLKNNKGVDYEMVNARKI